MSWAQREFEELYAIPSKNGLTRPARVRGVGYRMINMGELFAYDRIGNIEMERVPMSERDLSTMLVDSGDLLFARQSLILAGAGKCSIVRETDEPTTFESHIIRVRLRRDLAVPEFYHYYFKSPICKIRSIVTQGVQAGIRGNDLKRLQVHVPPVSKQNRIASILSNYDDLIENNRRRIQLLDQAARLLYKEWFVHLRFPGHEHVKIKDGVPEGWSKERVGDLCESVNYGYTASATDQATGPKYLRITDIVPQIIGWGNVPFCAIPDNKIEKFSLRTGDIVVARTGATVGYAKRIHKLHPEAVFASYLVRLRPRPDVDNHMLGVFVESDEYKAYIKANIGGAAQPNANARVIAGAKVLVPKFSLQQTFRDVVEPILDQRDVLVTECEKFRQARDLLLPRLMNEEIVV